METLTKVYRKEIQIRTADSSGVLTARHHTKIQNKSQFHQQHPQGRSEGITIHCS